ncbi:Gfo/Idh/MocA family oxidoreductase [Pseudomaricurvus sp.]|uniref:Gfo/Idh/MocA family oxidoreductase n=1 Tax=Pseudomaricurvus sp. TaxID=2004510 RepID=UPI003F6CDCD0
MATQSNPNADIRVGLIGYGPAGAFFHAPLIDAAQGLQLTAIVTGNPERAAAAQKAYPQTTIYPSAQALWQAAATLDLVVIASPNSTHKPLALEALNAGLGVIVDKPLAATAKDAKDVIETAERLGLFLSVFQNRRWDGDFLTLQRLRDAGKLGDVRRFESRFERWRLEPRSGWRQSAAPEEAGGVLFDLGSHLIDQALTLFGPVESVYAELNERYPNSQVDDDSFVALTHCNGVRSHLWMSSVAPHAGLRFRVLGSQAGYCSHGLDGQEDALKSGARPDQSSWTDNLEITQGSLHTGEDQSVFDNDQGQYLSYYEQIANAIRNHTPAPVDPRDSVSMLAIVEAAQRSSSIGALVKMEPTPQ